MKPLYDKTFSRIDRIERALLQELSQLICGDLKDPRIRSVIPTHISVTKDCGHANVYYTILAKGPCSDTQDALEKATGYLRSQMSQKIRLFRLPQLHFFYDTIFERQNALGALFDKIQSETPPKTPSEEKACE